ncbi:MAG: phosphotransferase, partial [Prevotella sp.]|nr:phosphotransferase [Prevotella sp.]
FIYLARHFASCHLPVPQVLAVSDDEMCYLQTDLGAVSLFDALKGGREAGGRYNVEEQQLLRQTIRELPRMQVEGARGLDFSQCYPQAEFDRESVMFDLNYFKYCFLKATDIDFNELKLEADFRLMAKDLTLPAAASHEASVPCFLYRDFQARNVMLTPLGGKTQSTVDTSPKGEESRGPFFIDFQGGRRGPYYYDVASFLWQASARYSHKLRRELVREYYETLSRYMEVPSHRQFVERLSLFVLFRILQVLGAYGFRGYFERKQHFIDSIPPALQNLRELLQMEHSPAARYPYLMDVLRRLCEGERKPTPTLKPTPTPPQGRGLDTLKADESTGHPAPPLGRGGLVVRIFSFSYKRGIPEDESGNGGGYVFDCRSTHNPGRYEPYKQLTGLDEPVIRFLEDDGEILTFLESVYKLADAHVERYIQRGFTSLMFSFGCTGGQHRSVYSAQHLAEHLNRKYGIEVRLCHREQNITQVFSHI